jgi:hypothetical protein
MLKTCPSCSYIGNDSEHTCPFCKADLATARPRRAMKLGLPILALALLVSASLTSCSVSPDGPATFGASHGSLGSTNMADYYYSKLPGVKYTYSNVQHIYNADGSVTTLTGAPDYVTSLGYSGITAGGDSMYKIAITYRVASQYAGRMQMPLYYIAGTNKTTGGYVADNTPITGAQEALAGLKRPRPVSTDTILAGVVGRLRTLTDDFTNSGNYVWQTDTMWLTCVNDSVYLWEHPANNPSTIMKVRCVFTKDFINNPTSNSSQTNISWFYDPTPDQNQALKVGWGTNTSWKVANADFSANVPAGIFNHSSKVSVTTPGVHDKMTTDEYKVFSFGIGLTQLTSSWYVTSDGSTFTKQDFTRSLESITTSN